MKKVLLIAVAVLSSALFTNNVNAQAKQQLSFGIIGVAYEIPLSSVITIAPTAFTNFELSHLTVGVKANYYFDDLIGLPTAWDVYAGANTGFGIAMGSGNSSQFNFGLQVGGRWFWSETWGVYLELGGGAIGGAGGGVGLTMVM